MNKKTFRLLFLCCFFAAIIGLFVLSNFGNDKNQMYQPKFRGFLHEKMIIEPNFYTYEEMMELTGEYIDSLYEVEIKRIISPQEARKLPDYDKVPFPEENTFYECLVKYDFLNEVDVNKDIYLRVYGSPEWQLAGNPPYLPGTKLIGFLSKPYSNIIYFVVTCFIKSGDEYVYSTEWRETDLDYLSIEMSEDESTVITTNKENPMRFARKFKLDEILNFLITDAYEHNAFVKKESP